MTHIDELIDLLNELKKQSLPDDIKILIYSSVNDYKLKLEKLIASINPVEKYSDSTKEYISVKRKELDEHYEMVISLIPAMLYYLVQKNK
jgi:hypothetical protein